MQRLPGAFVVFALAVSSAGCTSEPQTPAPVGFARISFASYWYIDEQTQSVIEIKNALDMEVTVQPVLRTKASEEVKLDPVSIAPHEVRRVPITPDYFRIKAKPAAGSTKGQHWGDGSIPGSLTGSAELHVLRPDIAGADNVAAWIVVESEDRGLGLVTTFHSEPLGDSHPSEFNGMWWLPSKEARAYYALQNTFPEDLDVQVTLSADKGIVVEKKLRIPAGHSHLMDIRRLVESETAAAVGGIKVRHESRPGQRGGVIGRGIVIDESRGFSTPLNLYKAAKGSGKPVFGTVKGVRTELHAPLAYFGPLSRLVPRSTDVMTPYLLISNTSGAEISIEGGVHGRSTDGETATTYLEPMTVPAHSSRLLDLKEVRKRSGVAFEDGVAGVELWHDEGANDVIADVINVSESWDMALYDRTTNTAQYDAASLAAISLRLDEAAHSFLILKNTTNQVQHPQVFLDVGGQSLSYSVPDIAIKPHQVKVIDIKALRDGQVADGSGAVLPKDLQLTSARVVSEPGAIVGSDPNVIFRENNTTVDFAPSCMVIITQDPPGGGPTTPSCRADAVQAMKEDGTPIAMPDSLHVREFNKILDPPLEHFSWNSSIDTFQPSNVDNVAELRGSLISRDTSARLSVSTRGEIFCKQERVEGIGRSCVAKLRCPDTPDPNCTQNPQPSNRNHGCGECSDKKVLCLAGAGTCDPDDPNSNEWAQANVDIFWLDSPHDQLNVIYSAEARTGGPDDPDDIRGSDLPRIRVLYQCK